MERKSGILASLWLWLGIGLVVGALVGVGTMALINQSPAPHRTFTVVAHHWGFALYDEEGNEVPSIQVARGTEVTLLVIGAEALSHEIHEAYEERTIAAWADKTAYGGKNATEIMEEIEEAEDAGLFDHSVMIQEYGIDIVTDSEAPSPVQFTFIADKAGTFNIMCNHFCGWGHQYMTLQGGLVVT